MKFDFAIGNPPYMEEKQGMNEGFMAPVYDKFIDAASDVAEKVELIHPARFLFNAGSTPKAWNEKMLQDEHFKVLEYEEDATKVFSNTEIKGGVAITYRDSTKVFGAINTYTPYLELNSIMRKVNATSGFSSIMEIIFIQNKFNLDMLYEDFPDYKAVVGSNGKDARLEKNIFTKMPEAFLRNKFDNSTRTLGIFNNKREWRFISSKYLDINHENYNKYKVVLPVANGNGVLGETLSSPTVLKPMEAYTRSFIGIGSFDTEAEALNALRYISSKFCRTLLAILKVTQMTNKDVWKYVPIQNFTNKSDIDWATSTENLDKQLYKKYGLSHEEIEFIESRVKEMK